MGLHHLFIKPCLGQLFRVLAVLGFQLLGFLLFSSLFYIFYSFLDIFGGKKDFIAFWRHFKLFGDLFDGFYGFLMEIW